ncbi:hypothetical protein ACFO3O_18170 [Dokdonia ponticola]|uniref:Bacteriocin n=1 Tax=Dokdonia ponticola TaxID=2041041 RepID=A0ABV9I0Y3_9FLAO
MKKLINLKGAVTLNNVQQKEVNGGGGRKQCSSSCTGKPRGSRCYYGGHCLCPGVCLGGCVPL